jgi:type III secretory pathway component EscT
MTALALCGFLLIDLFYAAAAALRDSSFRGARLVDPALELAPSDFGVNFLGFLLSPFVEAGGLFSLLAVEAAGFDWLVAAGLFVA